MVSLDRTVSIVAIRLATKMTAFSFLHGILVIKQMIANFSLLHPPIFFFYRRYGSSPMLPCFWTFQLKPLEFENDGKVFVFHTKHTKNNACIYWKCRCSILTVASILHVFHIMWAGATNKDLNLTLKQTLSSQRPSNYRIQSRVVFNFLKV